MVELPGHRTQSTHLPEEPLVDLDAAALVLRIEFAGLAAEILQDRTGLEDRDRPIARTVRVDDRRHAIVRRNLEEFRLELLPLCDVHRDHLVGEPALLQHDRDLEAVRRRPVPELARLLRFRRRALWRRLAFLD